VAYDLIKLVLIIDLFGKDKKDPILNLIFGKRIIDDYISAQDLQFFKDYKPELDKYNDLINRFRDLSTIDDAQEAERKLVLSKNKP